MPLWRASTSRQSKTRTQPAKYELIFPWPRLAGLWAVGLEILLKLPSHAHPASLPPLQGKSKPSRDDIEELDDEEQFYAHVSAQKDSTEGQAEGEEEVCY